MATPQNAPTRETVAWYDPFNYDRSGPRSSSPDPYNPPEDPERYEEWLYRGIPETEIFDIPDLGTSIISLKSPSTVDLATTPALEMLKSMAWYDEITPFAFFHRGTVVHRGDGIIKRFAPSFSVSEYHLVLDQVADQVKVDDIFARQFVKPSRDDQRASFNQATTGTFSGPCHVITRRSGDFNHGIDFVASDWRVNR